jgi:hypothetical protein
VCEVHQVPLRMDGAPLISATPASWRGRDPGLYVGEIVSHRRSELPESWADSQKAPTAKRLDAKARDGCNIVLTKEAPTIRLGVLGTGIELCVCAHTPLLPGLTLES